MVAIMLILAVLALIAIGAGIGSRRKADERAGVARERAHIADDLAGREHEAAIR